MIYVKVVVIFKGTVRRRSSANPPLQPEVAGEGEVFRCNPQRKNRIMEKTGWNTVFDGTLNLVADEGMLNHLKTICPLFFESPKDIKHPTNQEIPVKRGGYNFFLATASVRDMTQEVLIRQACNPHDERCVELIAPIKLMDFFKIDDGDEIKVTAMGISSAHPIFFSP